MINLIYVYLFNLTFIVIVKGIIYCLITSGQVKNINETNIEDKLMILLKKGEKIHSISFLFIKNCFFTLIKYSFKLVFILDFEISDIVKKIIKKRFIINEKKLKTEFITKSNLFNLCLAAVFFVFYHLKIHVNSDNKWMLFIILRTLYRELEIMIAFIKDVIFFKKENNSNLLKHDRIRLALTSYLEIIILNSIVYKVVFNLSNWLESFTFSFGVTSLGDFNFIKLNAIQKSILKLDKVKEYSYLTKDIQKIYIEFYIGNISMIFQLLTTLSLIVLSLAIYIGKEEGAEV